MLTNLSFETAGTDPGSAASWTWTRTAPFLFEGFLARTGLSRFDGFEVGWGVDDFVDELVVPTNATAFEFANGTPAEGFETGWRLPNSHGLAQSGIVHPFGNVAPFVLALGRTLSFQINGVTVVTTFQDVAHGGYIANIAAALAIEVVHAINVSIGDADIIDGFAYLDAFGHVLITTDETGPGASIAILGGTAAAALGFVVGTYQGGVNVTHPGNETAVFAFSGGAADIFSIPQYPPSGVTFDGFERGWPSNEIYFRSFDAVASQTAVFAPDSNAFENFEAGWDDNQDYIFEFTTQLSPELYATSIQGFAGTVSSVTFGSVTMTGVSDVPVAYGTDGSFVKVSGAATSANNGTFPLTSVSGTTIVYANAAGHHPDANSGSIETQIFTPFENFEYVLADKQVVPTFNGSPSFFSYTAAPVFGDGARVTIYAGVAPNGQAGIIPTGVNPLIQYFVEFSSGGTPNVFCISIDGSSALDFTDNGSGVIMVKGDPAIYWTQTVVGI